MISIVYSLHPPTHKHSNKTPAHDHRTMQGFGEEGNEEDLGLRSGKNRCAMKSLHLQYDIDLLALLAPHRRRRTDLAVLNGAQWPLDELRQPYSCRLLQPACLAYNSTCVQLFLPTYPPVLNELPTTHVRASCLAWLSFWLQVRLPVALGNSCHCCPWLRSHHRGPRLPRHTLPETRCA